MNQEIPFCPFLAKDKFLFIVMNGKPFFDMILRNMKNIKVLADCSSLYCACCQITTLVFAPVPTSTSHFHRKKFPLPARLYFLHFFVNSRFQYFASPSSFLFFVPFSQPVSNSYWHIKVSKHSLDHNMIRIKNLVGRNSKWMGWIPLLNSNQTSLF